MESGYEPQEGVPDKELGDNRDDLPQRTSILRRRDPEQADGSGGPPDGGLTIDEADDPMAQGAGRVAVTLKTEAPAEGGRDAPVLPKQPRTLAEVGLSKAFLTDLAIKIIHYSGTPTATQLQRRLGLGQSMVKQILTTLQEERLCEVLSQSDLFTGNYRYRLSERGTARASEALERTRYAGPVPVTADQYAEVIRAQQARRQAQSPEHIKAILRELVLAPEVEDAVARALYSGKTSLFYGLSGNGKTSILERFARNLEGAVLMPYAIYAYGQVIRVFDASIHQPLEEPEKQNGAKDDRMDRRWVVVRRPAVVLGSEVGPEYLKLAHDPQARFYQASPHLKAQGGVLVVDDLGRQKTDPRELMTRWLIAVERGSDSLSLETGEKVSVPFDVQLLFGTNRPIDQLADEALLRRILYKVEIRSPGPQEFAEMLRRLCRQKNVGTAEGAIERIVERLYSQSSETPRASYARDLLEVVIEGASYDGREAVLDDESFERAFKLFMSQHGAGEEG